MQLFSHLTFGQHLRRTDMLFVLVGLSLVWFAYPILTAPTPSTRRHPGPAKAKLQLTVSPTTATLYPGRKVSIKCKVKGTYAITQSLDIGFYMLLKKSTVLPLSSGMPGVSIRTSVVEGRPGSRHPRTVTRLTLHQEMYQLLQTGENYFCCKAFLIDHTNSSVHRYVDYFVVRKKPRRRAHTNRR